MTSEKHHGWTRRRFLQGVATAAAASSLTSRTAARILATPGTANPTAPFSRFVDVAAKAGLTHTMFYGDNSHVTYITESMGGGCAFFDYDNDGWMDVFITGGRRLENIPPGASNRLYRNNRDGTFTDVTEKSGLLDAGWATGVCAGDYDNDGFEDLFVTYYGHNRLYHNNGDGTFTDATAKAGLATQPRFGSGCTFLDYNRDGFLDLFVANYIEFDPANAPKPSLQIPNCSYEGVPVYCTPRAFPAPPHFLYRNNGDGTFTDVSKESGIAAIRGSYGLTAVAFDADEDGWPDIFVACDSTPSMILMNNRDGTFREQGLLRGIALSGDGQELGSMGVGVGDFDLDGHLDVVKTHFLNQATGLYRGNAKGEFEDITSAAGLGSDRRFISWGTGFADLDNDGNPDILLVTGTVYPELERAYPAKYPAHSPRIIFRNRGDGTFAELIDEAGPGISAHHMSRGCAFGDFDNDGDLDVLVMNINEPPSLLRNDAPAHNHWLKVRLEGTKSNRSAIGARVLARYGGKAQAQCVMSQTSYLSANDPRLHFGLGAAKTADIEIHWPNGGTETCSALNADQLVTIREGQGVVKGRPFR